MRILASLASFYLSSSIFCGNCYAAQVDKIVAVVGSEIILFSELSKETAPALQQLERAADESGTDLMAGRRKAQVVQETLDKMIDELLVRKEAREMNIEVTSDEIDRAVENMARENGIDVETLKKAIKAQGMDIPSYRNKLRNQILRYKVLNLRVRRRVKISDAEARQYYNNQVRDVRATGSFEGAHILFRVDPNARAVEAAKSRKRAEEILARLRAGEDFATLAKQYSEDEATRKYGGSLGVQNPGTIPPTLEHAFFDLEAGEIAGPIRTSAGFHIIKLVNREALGVQPFSEVKDKIVGQLTQEEMLRQEGIWLKELRIKTFIDLRLK